MNITIYTNNDELAKMITNFIAYHHILGDVIKSNEVYINEEHIKQTTYKIVLYNITNLYMFDDYFRIDKKINDRHNISAVINKKDINVINTYIDVKRYNIQTLIKEK